MLSVKEDILNKTFLEFVCNTTDIKIEKKIKLKDIFKDSWDDFIIYVKANNLVIRDVVFEEVEKIMNCGSLSEGYYTYVCNDCGKIKFSPFHCHSRFCPSYGVKNILVKSESILEKLINVKHRHIVFTIPQELRNLFRMKRKDCIDILFETVNDTIMYMIKRATKKYEEYMPGYIASLHTFGRDLKWNPHIHVIIAECVSGKSKIFKPLFFPFELFRKSFQNVLLKKLEQLIGIPNFRALKNKIYSNTKKGFYVYAKEKKCNHKMYATYFEGYIRKNISIQIKKFIIII